LHHAISPFSELYNDNLLLPIIITFKVEGKKCTPPLFLQCRWSFHSVKVMRLGKHVHSSQRKATPTQLNSFMSSLCACVASSASIQCIFSTYGLVRSNIRNRMGEEKAVK